MYFTYAFTYDLYIYLHIYIYIFTFIFTYTFYTYDYTCMYICIYVYFTLSPYTETTSAISLVRFFFWKPQVALQGFVPREWWGDGMKASWAIFVAVEMGTLNILEFVMCIYIYIKKIHIYIYRITGSCSCVCWLVCLFADHVDAIVFYIYMFFLVASYIGTLVDILIPTICCLHVFHISACFICTVFAYMHTLYLA